MRSKANIKTHPIHPMLVVFPIAFFTGAIVFDVISALSSSDTLWQFSRYLILAGIIGGLSAAVPGLIDYVFTVPPESSAKKRATIHMIVNVSAVAIFAFVYFYRVNATSHAAVIAVETAAFALMTVGGWLGGTLVYRNEIGVDIRYAGAGKWIDVSLEGKGPDYEVKEALELKTNQMMLARVKGKRIVIGRTEERLFAFSDHCTHKGGSLAGGSLTCSVVQCPWHGSQFDIRTGEVKCGPAKEKIALYTLKETPGRVVLTVT